MKISNMKILLTAVCLILSLLPARAQGVHDFIEGGFKYYIENDTAVTISDAGDDAPIPVTADSTLTIPSTVVHEGRTYRVTYIATKAFSVRREIRHLVIGEGVEIIGPYAFARCPNLTSMEIPSTLSCAPCYEEGFFYGCSNLCRITVDRRNEEFDSRDDCNAIICTETDMLLLGCRSTVIPPTVTTIGPKAFDNCTNLVRLVLPEGVRRIEYQAFRDCINLKEIVLPSTLDSIGGSVFENCMNLESVTIPRGVTKISPRVFSGCYNLKEVRVDKANPTFDSRKHCNAIIDTAQDTIVAGCGNSFIPEGIKGIGAFAFANSSLREIKIPRSVRHIGDRAFAECHYCNAVSVHPGNPVYDSRGDSNAIIESATGRLVQGCSLTSVPDGVREIGDYAFFGVRLPPHLVIPEGVETIGYWAFSNYCAIQYVVLPSSLKWIKARAFGCIDALRYVDMSRCSPRVEVFAFSGCKALNVVDLSPHPGIIDNLAFANCPCKESVLRQVRRQGERGDEVPGQEG